MGLFNVFVSISAKNGRFSFRKKLLKGKNALFEVIKLANAHGSLLGVLRYSVYLISLFGKSILCDWDRRPRLQMPSNSTETLLLRYFTRLDACSSGKNRQTHTNLWDFLF